MELIITHKYEVYDIDKYMPSKITFQNINIKRVKEMIYYILFKSSQICPSYDLGSDDVAKILELFYDVFSVCQVRDYNDISNKNVIDLHVHWEEYGGNNIEELEKEFHKEGLENYIYLILKNMCDNNANNSGVCSIKLRGVFC